MSVLHRMQFPGPLLESVYCTAVEKTINIIYGENGALSIIPHDDPSGSEPL